MVMTEYTITLKAHNKIVENLRNSNGPDITRLIKKYQNQTNEIKDLQDKLTKKGKNSNLLQLPDRCFIKQVECHSADRMNSFFEITIIANSLESAKYFYDYLEKQ